MAVASLGEYILAGPENTVLTRTMLEALRARTVGPVETSVLSSAMPIQDAIRSWRMEREEIANFTMAASGLQMMAATTAMSKYASRGALLGLRSGIPPLDTGGAAAAGLPSRIQPMDAGRAVSVTLFRTVPIAAKRILDAHRLLWILAKRTAGFTAGATLTTRTRSTGLGR